MTITTTNTAKSYTADGVTTDYPTVFEYLADSTVTVYYQTTAGAITTLASPTNYTIAGGNGSTGTVTLVDPATDAPTGGTLNITRFVPQVQLTNLQNGEINLETIETMSDIVTMISQQQQTQIDANTGIAVESIQRDVTNPSEWDAKDTVINSLGTPVSDADAATKLYVDLGVAL